MLIIKVIYILSIEYIHDADITNNKIDRLLQLNGHYICIDIN